MPEFKSLAVLGGWGGVPKHNLLLVRSSLVCCPRFPKEDLGQDPKKDQEWEELSWYEMRLTVPLKFWQVAVFRWQVNVLMLFIGTLKFIFFISDSGKDILNLLVLLRNPGNLFYSLCFPFHSTLTLLAWREKFTSASFLPHPQLTLTLTVSYHQ